MRSRWLDALVLLAIVAVGFGVYRDRLFQPAGTETPSADLPAPQVPGFAAPLAQGGELRHDPGSGPLVVLMTAPLTCGSCRNSGAVDLQAEAVAVRHRVPVFHMFVGVPADQAPALMPELGTAPVLTALDPQWKACQALGGSDDTCWLVIGRRGEKVWQGGRDLEALEKAVSSL